MSTRGIDINAGSGSPMPSRRIADGRLACRLRVAHAVSPDAPSGHPALRPFEVSLRLLKIAPGDFVEPLDLIARLAALVPRPRVNQTRYHGVLAPNHRWRAAVTPAGRGRGKRVAAQPEKSTIERHVAMSWAQRLKRVFGIDVESCVRCGKAVRVAAPAHPCARGISASLHVIVCIEEPVLIERILAHVRGKAGSDTAARGPPSTGPPVSA